MRKGPARGSLLGETIKRRTRQRGDGHALLPWLIDELDELPIAAKRTERYIADGAKAMPLAHVPVSEPWGQDALVTLG